jgi:hypothetical protein
VNECGCGRLSLLSATGGLGTLGARQNQGYEGDQEE